MINICIYVCKFEINDVGEPDGGPEQSTVYLRATGKWETRNPANHLAGAFICQMPAAGDNITVIIIISAAV